MPNTQTPSFETAFQEIEELIHFLDDGKVTLEEAISAFERGAHLVQYCKKKLSEGSMRVSKIKSEVLAGDDVVLEPLFEKAPSNPPFPS